MSRSRGRFSRAGSLPLALAAGLIVGACGVSPGAPTATPPSSPPPSSVPSAAPTAAPEGWYEACAGAAATPITLTAWDHEGDETLGAVIDQANADFESSRWTPAVDAMGALRPRTRA